MNVRKNRKLSLNRESVRRLDNRELEQAAGGAGNTYMRDGGNWCSTQYMTHCIGCTEPCPRTWKCTEYQC